MLQAVRAARSADPISIETAFGFMEGFKAEAVIKLVVEIIKSLRYADSVGSLKLLGEIYREEQSEQIRKQILDTIKNLSEYNIDVYNQVGPRLEDALVEHLENLPAVELDAMRAIALVVWGEALQSDITGAKWKAESVVLSTGAVPASDALKVIRNKAIVALFAAYDRSENDSQRLAVLSALESAKHTPHQVAYSNELLAVTVDDNTRIVEFMTSRVSGAGLQFLQHVEHQFLYDYYRGKQLATTESNFDCKLQAGHLLDAISRFRVTVNMNQRFVRYKVLVGFESVYPDHWADEDYDFTKAEEYRRVQSDGYLESITDSVEDEWFEQIEYCAQTESSDMATFPVFGSFISSLSQRKPKIADRYLAKASEQLRNFLPGFLNGLALSGEENIYRRNFETELASARNLIGLARHLRYSAIAKPQFAERVLSRAIYLNDEVGVIECLLLGLEHYSSDRIGDPDEFVRDALAFLNAHKNASWVSEAWFLPKLARFYEELKPDRLLQLLQNLVNLKKINYQVERILAKLAERNAAVVWDYFGTRLAQEISGTDEHYEAVPFRLHGLEKVLSLDPELAIRKGLEWYAIGDRRLFEFRGGQLLSAAFPDCTPEFSAALAELVKPGGRN